MYSARCNAYSASRLIELTARKNYKKEKIEAYIISLFLFLFILAKKLAIEYLILYFVTRSIVVLQMNSIDSR